MLRSRRCRSCFWDRRSQLISPCLPELAAQPGLAPAQFCLTSAWTTKLIIPLTSKLVGMAGFHRLPPVAVRKDPARQNGGIVQ